MSKNSYILIKSIDALRIISKYYRILRRSADNEKIIYYESCLGDSVDSSKFVLIKYFKRDYYFLNKRYLKLAKELNIKL